MLTTKEFQPAPGTCPLPVILLLEEEPENEPEGVSDWLVRERVTGDVLRRSLRYVREQGTLRQTLNRLAEQDALTG
ncbi:MAG: GGDEF-domain containing protein, partial [Pseudomonas marincola]